MRFRLLASLPLAVAITFLMLLGAASLVAAVERSGMPTATAPRPVLPESNDLPCGSFPCEAALESGASGAEPARYFF